MGLQLACLNRPKILAIYNDLPVHYLRHLSYIRYATMGIICSKTNVMTLKQSGTKIMVSYSKIEVELQSEVIKELGCATRL